MRTTVTQAMMMAVFASTFALSTEKAVSNPALIVENMRLAADAARATGRSWQAARQSSRFLSFTALAFGSRYGQGKGDCIAESKTLAREYDKYERVTTELVGYGGTVLDVEAKSKPPFADNFIHQPFVDAANGVAFRGVRTKRGSALTVGHFLARDGSGKYAMMVVPSDDPYGTNTAVNTLVFTARACWAKGWWTDNLVNEDGTFNEPACARVKTVTAELRTIVAEYEKYRRVKTDLVGFRGTSFDVADASFAGGRINQSFLDESNGLAFAGVKAVDGAALVAGYFLERDGSGRCAMLVVAVDDPEDCGTKSHVVRFRAPWRKVSALGGRGTVKLRPEAEGAYAFDLRSNDAVFVIAD